MAAAVLVRDGTEEVTTSNLTAGGWLEGARRGAYTTARTVGGSRVFEFETHVARLAESARLMMQDDGDHALIARYPALTDAVLLREKVTAALRKGVAVFRKGSAAGTDTGDHRRTDD